MGSEAVAGEPRLPAGAHIDPAEQLAFLDQRLLGAAGFVREGGSKLKLILGGPGAGKTHFLAALLAAARAQGFLAVHVDARARPLWGFDLLYQALAAEIDFADLGGRFVSLVLAEAGYAGPPPAPGQALADWAAAQGHEPHAVRARFDDELHRRLLSNRDLHYGYAVGLARWCEALVGLGTEGAQDGLLEHWLRGGRVGVRDCNRLRLRRAADRYTARLWLRSLVHFARLAGYPGLVAGVDGMEVVCTAPPRPGAEARGTSPTAEAGGAAPPDPGAASAHPLAGNWGAFVSGTGDAPPHYTKQRRDDLYDSLRTLIDDMGLVPGLLLALAGPPELVRDARLGFKSYPALAERVQSEVETVELNRFADEIALERLWAADPDAGRALAEGLLRAVAPGAASDVRERALAAAAAQWAAQGVTVSAVRRSVLAVLQVAAGSGPVPGGREGAGGDGA